MTAAIIVFALTYLAIASPRLPLVRIDRPAAALCGAVAMVATGVLPLGEAYAAVDLGTLSLLLGMMILAAYLAEAAFFRTSAWWILGRTHSARRLLWALTFAAGGLSALLVNDTVCLMLTPLVLVVADEARLPPLPFLLALATGSNIGSAATFTGNPQNMLVGTAAQGVIGYLHYFALMAPIAVVGLAADAALLTWLFRAQLPTGELPRIQGVRPPLDPVLAGKSLAALALFVILAALGNPLPGSALVSASLLILFGQIEPKRALARVDWSLILFFGGLFVVVHGLARSGALELALEPLRPLIARGGSLGLIGLAVLTVVGSNLVSNVPFVLVAVRWVPAMPEPRWGYIVVALASTLAGNLTMFGSVANLIVLEGSGEHGKVSFFQFLRIGALVTAVTLTLSLGLVGAERALGL